MRQPWQNRIVGYGEEAPDQLLANPRNARIHPKAQQDALGGVLREVGIVQNVIVNRITGMVVDGHARIALALRDNQPLIPITYVELSEAEEAVILATLDPIGAAAAWDRDKLDALLRDVTTGEAGVQALLAELAEEQGVTGMGAVAGDEDAPAEVDESGPTRCQPGDVWQCGRHLVACLSSTERANIEAVVAGRKVAMVWADPPYGIKIVQGGSVGGSKPITTNASKLAGRDKNTYHVNNYAPVIGDNSIDTAVDAATLCLKHYADAIHFWWGANNYAHALPPSTCWIVWDKENTGNFADAELAWSNHASAVRIFRHMWNGVCRDSEHGEMRTHPNQKPVALCAWAFEKYGAVGDIILDPFLGSGPSLKAAEQSNRTVIGFELSPHYCDHIIDWWEQRTGQQAMCVSSDTLPFGPADQDNSEN